MQREIIGIIFLESLWILCWTCNMATNVQMIDHHLQMREGWSRQLLLMGDMFLMLCNLGAVTASFYWVKRMIMKEVKKGVINRDSL